MRLLLAALLAVSAYGQYTFSGIFCTSAVGSDAYACTPNASVVSYQTGDFYAFKADVANTGTASFNAAGLGAKTIVIAAGGVTTTLSDNAIRAGQLVVLQYDGTNMQMQSTSGIAASVNTGTTGQLAYYASNGAAISGTTAAPDGTTATKQPVGDSTAKLATDDFVAAAIQASSPDSTVQVSTTAVLPNTPTYSNGTAGVGATITAGSNTTLSAIDGYSVQLNDRILVQNQASTFQNGCYTLTQAGSGSLPWILTRCVNYNTVVNINYTASTCTIQTGSTYAASTCFSLTNLISAVGSSAITYTQQAAGSNASKPGGGVQIVGNVTAGDALKVASGTSGKNIQDAGVAFSSLTQTIASGTKALATSAISSGTCSSAQTSSATGTLTTDNIVADFNADPTGVTGYSPTTNGMLTIIKYPTADTVNFKVCNNTSASVTPGAITLNWRVVR